VPSFRRRASVTDTDKVSEPLKELVDPDAANALALAEEAEAEAAEAEALAAAARARARAIRLRREAAASGSKSTNGSAAAVESEPTETAPADEAEPEPESESLTDDILDDEAVDEAVVGEKADTLLDGPGDLDEPVVLDEPEEVRASSRRDRGRVLKIVAMTLAILCTVALLALSAIMVVVMSSHRRDAAAEQKLNAEYAAAGRQSVVTLMSLDFNKAQEDVQRIIDNSTGQFKTDFQNQAADFVKVAQDSKVVTDVTINSTAVESMSQDKATVLVAATSRVTNSAGAKQEPRAWRLSVELQRDNGQIKMSKVEFVP
jgi:Mce-associated membrane protein